MFVRVSALLLAVPLLVSAIPHGGWGGDSVSQCNTGPVQCCNSVEDSSHPKVQSLSGLLGIVLPDLNVPVGLKCTPISVLGAGSNNCASQPVCCENNHFEGLINVGCTPINLSL